MNKQVLFYLAIALAVLGVLLGIYYLIPGIYHPVYSGRHQAAYTVHKLYAVAGFGLAILGGAASFVLRPKSVNA